MRRADLLRLIDGKHAKEENIIGRCHLLAHPGYLSKKLVKSHDCIGKKCPFLEKLKPEYWKALEKAVKEKKENRLKRKETLRSENDRDAFIRETLEESGNIHVTSIKEEGGDLIVISYIYDRRTNLAPEIQILRERLKKTIKLQARIGSEEVIEQLIRKPRREMGKGTDLLNAPKVGSVTKKRLERLGVYCLEDLFGHNADTLYEWDCQLSGQSVNRRYLSAYRSAIQFADEME